VARALAKAWEKPVRWTLPPEKIKDVCQYLERCDSDDFAAMARELVPQLVAAATAIGPDEERGGPILIRLSDVQPRPLEWLWPGRIPIGKLTLIAGDPGLGKSFVTLDMAGRVSRGTPWPDRLHEPNPC
jgi:hypothetical protein